MSGIDDIKIKDVYEVVGFAVWSDLNFPRTLDRLNWKVWMLGFMSLYAEPILGEQTGLGFKTVPPDVLSKLRNYEMKIPAGWAGRSKQDKVLLLNEQLGWAQQLYEDYSEYGANKLLNELQQQRLGVVKHTKQLEKNDWSIFTANPTIHDILLCYVLISWTYQRTLQSIRRLAPPDANLLQPTQDPDLACAEFLQLISVSLQHKLHRPRAELSDLQYSLINNFVARVLHKSNDIANDEDMY